MSLLQNAIFILLGLLMSILNAFSQNSRLPQFSDSAEPRLLAASIVDAMTDTEALGQVLMFGYGGESPDRNLMGWIENEGLGAVKIFGINANNLGVLAHTTRIYQAKALASRFGIPLLVATDQEGGQVRHVRGDTAITAGNMALGASRMPINAWQTGLIVGRELAMLGINMNFAPTIDVFLNKKSDVIGSRSFGNDPGMVGILGMAFAKGQQQSGVITTAKHFPGHGDTAADSHGTLPVINVDLKTLRERDLLPYRQMIAGGLPAIMIGHLAFPNITGNETPATLSYALMTELLRDEMGFKGVTVTDDLFMHGARSSGLSMDEISYRAMKAGADILLLSTGGNDRLQMYQRLVREMEADASFNTRVRESAERVVQLKAEWLKAAGVREGAGLAEGDVSVDFLPSSELTMPDKQERARSLLEHAARSLTLLKKELFPVLPEDAGRVLLVGNYNDFFKEGKKRYPDARTWRLEYQSESTGARERGRTLLKVAANFDTIIILVPDEQTARIISELQPLSERMVLFSVFSPTPLANLEWAATSLALYGAGQKSFQVAFAAMAGDFMPRGQLPFSLNQS